MYNKLFTKILDSSIWLEPDSTRIVWMTLLASMDEDGFCAFACAANVANRARVSLEAAEAALKTLESPDPNSADPEQDGRRIERVPGGWYVRNGPKYRELAARETMRENHRLRSQRYRDRQRDASVTGGDVACRNQKHIQKQNHESKPDGFDVAAQEIFEYFLKATHKNPRIYLFSTPRKTKTKARLAFCQKLAKDGSLENAIGLLKVAIDRFAASSFHNGHNERGKKYLDLELLFRSDDYLSKWLDDSNFQLQGELA